MLLAFLTKNWEPSKIFMGDTGSLVIGTILAVLTIEFLNKNFQLDQNDPVKFQASIPTAFCVLVIPLVDTVRVIIIRVYRRISPLTPDKRHIHHALLKLSLSHAHAVSVLCLIHVIFIVAAILLRHLGDLYVLTSTVLTAITLCLILDRVLFLRTLRR